MGDTGDARQLREAGVPSSSNTTRTSTLPDLTRRPDWSERIIDGLPAILLLLDVGGRILHASASCKKITGHEASALQSRFITELIHRDDKAVFVKKFNHAILSRAPFRLSYRFLHADGEWLVLESQGHFDLNPPANHSPAASAAAAAVAAAGGGGGGRVPAEPPAPADPSLQLFLLTSLPYQSPNAALLDSFLELKTDNARLARRIARLKAEAAASLLVANEADTRRADARIETSLEHDDDNAGGDSASEAESDATTPTAGTQGSRRGSRADAGQKQKRNGKRNGKRKRRLKGEGEEDLDACAVCGAGDSPAWRTGPAGPRTLCNPCGLRWAKQMERSAKNIDTSPL